MKVLEINGFMTWAIGYEGAHEIVHWMPRQKRGMEEAHRRSRWHDLRSGLSLWTHAASAHYDLIVCAGFGRSYGKGVVRRLIKRLWEGWLIVLVKAIRRNAGCPLAVVDISDDCTIHPVNRGLLEAADVYFKRELPLDPYQCLDSVRGSWARQSVKRNREKFAEKNWISKLVPLPLGCREIEPEGTRLSAREKNWDIFYVGNDEYKPRRTGIDEALRELARDGYRVCQPEEVLMIEDYLETMRNARLALSPPGFGWDCHRHYEAAMLGTVVVTPFPTIQRHAPLKNGEHCFFYDPEKALAGQLKEMLEDWNRLDEIASQAREHARQKHTHQAIFQWIIERTIASRSSVANPLNKENEKKN